MQKPPMKEGIHFRKITGVQREALLLNKHIRTFL